LAKTFDKGDHSFS